MPSNHQFSYGYEATGRGHYEVDHTLSNQIYAIRDQLIDRRMDGDGNVSQEQIDHLLTLAGQVRDYEYGRDDCACTPVWDCFCCAHLAEARRLVEAAKENEL